MCRARPDSNMSYKYCAGKSNPKSGTVGPIQPWPPDILPSSLRDPTACCRSPRRRRRRICEGQPLRSAAGGPDLGRKRRPASLLLPDGNLASGRDPPYFPVAAHYVDRCAWTGTQGSAAGPAGARKQYVWEMEPQASRVRNFGVIRVLAGLNALAMGTFGPAKQLRDPQKDSVRCLGQDRSDRDKHFFRSRCWLRHAEGRKVSSA